MEFLTTTLAGDFPIDKQELVFLQPIYQHVINKGTFGIHQARVLGTSDNQF